MEINWLDKILKENILDFSKNMSVLDEIKTSNKELLSDKEFILSVAKIFQKKNYNYWKDNAYSVILYLNDDLKIDIELIKSLLDINGYDIYYIDKNEYHIEELKEFVEISFSNISKSGKYYEQFFNDISDLICCAEDIMILAIKYFGCDIFDISISPIILDDLSKKLLKKSSVWKLLIEIDGIKGYKFIVNNFWLTNVGVNDKEYLGKIVDKIDKINELEIFYDNEENQ